MIRVRTWFLAFSLGIVAAACSGLGLPERSSTAANNAPAGVPPGTPQGVKIRMGVDPSVPPFATSGASPTSYSGFEIDLINSLASSGGWQAEFVQAEYSNLLKLVSQCRLDGGISSIPINEAMRPQMIFSQPYYTTGHVVVVKKGNLTITGIEKLSGSTVGAVEGSPSELELKKIAGVVPKIYVSYYTAFQDLITGNIDAVIADQPRAESYIAIKRNNLKIAGAPFGTIQFGIVVCRDQKDLAQKIDDGLKLFKTQGGLERLVKKWITR